VRQLAAAFVQRACSRRRRPNRELVTASKLAPQRAKSGSKLPHSKAGLGPGKWDAGVLVELSHRPPWGRGWPATAPSPAGAGRVRGFQNVFGGWKFSEARSFALRQPADQSKSFHFPWPILRASKVPFQIESI
jgi:hypothetical protein